MKRLEQKLVHWIALLGLVLSAAAGAQSQPSAHQVVSDTTEAVMKVVAEAREAGGDTSDEYYQQIEMLLDPVVDFRGFARGVMGPYATSERYRSLDEVGREKLAGQLDGFSDRIRDTMVRAYGKGLLAFGGSRIEVTQPASQDPKARRSTVQQLIYKEGSPPYVVLYQMGRERDGSWKLRNMIIENVNLGEIYRSQFQSAARKYDGDLDQVIDNWSVVDIES
ncbi:ABC transporter substrate-binding protein [Parahaliea maris]|uniref:ABC transporter substrate-binding protein n=1 Tax=Parahaliea maris TaxID=2716870 RepID=A0A5C9A6K5_9GAMM|nr:ABC transporter substrate-binding protein [Parahaliea maris]TXS96356.1 ABC transporter substrate-binding protein [Parahaliea maris]